MHTFVRLARPIMIAFFLGFGGSCSPTSPGKCVNGADGIGRGPIVVLRITCTPNESDLSCAATWSESSYCAGPDQDYTQKVIWISSTPSVADFVGPGQLKVRAPGDVQIDAVFGYLKASGGPLVAYAVAPGVAPEKLVDVTVLIQTMRAVSPSITLAEPLNGAILEAFSPQRPARSCATDERGRCQLWIVTGENRFRASKSGYSSVEDTRTAPFYPPAVSMVLRPITSS